MERRVFKKGSTSFYFSSLLFPKQARRGVFELYSFLRVADDYVDNSPDQPDKRQNMIDLWNAAKTDPEFSTLRKKEDTTNQRAVKNIIRLQRKLDFETEWIDKFLKTMQSDLDFKQPKNLVESLKYCEGSAEVVGLMMSRILGLPKQYDEQAKMLGRAFQWVNFIRDIDEDSRLGRIYFPKSDLQKSGLKELSKTTAHQNPERFERFIEFQANRYKEWRDQAKKAFPHIPKRQRLPLEVATRLFDWTIEQIINDPSVVYRQKVKPSKIQTGFFVFNRIQSVYFK